MISRSLSIMGSVIIWSVACVLGWLAIQAFGNAIPYTMRTVPDGDPAAADGTAKTPTRPETVDLSAVLARPLFAPDRRPLSTEATRETLSSLQPIAENTHPDILPEVIVYGVALTGSSTKALLSINDSAPDWYGENDIIAGWTLTKIETNGVLLQSETSELRIELY